MAIVLTPYVKSCMAIAKGLSNIATENEISLAKVQSVYNIFNELHKESEFEQYTVKADSSRQYIGLEEKALELTKRYFNIQKIRDLRDSKN
jgi:non-canonical (house-cleaning) NTP pyrophosphatase